MGEFLRYGTKTVIALAVSATAIATIVALDATSTNVTAAAQPASYVAPEASSFVISLPVRPTAYSELTGPTVPAAKPAPAAAVKPVHTVNVWTGGGSQSAINACRGGVDMTARYHVRTVAEHWSCGGSSFPTKSGTIIRLTGIDAGVYRVKGIVAILNAYTAHTNQIPRGYSALFQTCRGNDSHHTEFVALEKIHG